VSEIAFPWALDARGRTAGAELDRHIRDLIEQVLLTSPGERVNRPLFGSGLLALVFAPTGEEVATATQLTVHGALQEALGDVITIEAVEAKSVDSTLKVTVVYSLRSSGERQTARFERSV
jgi:phage baseplate assembly protein W